MTVRTVSTWRCEHQCDEHGSGTPDECHRAAERHVAKTGHTTSSSMRPAEESKR